ncbi:MAG TPA: hypothetical protein VGR38_08275 [Candidatus Polarisedimenticolia bacterium]|nr:hypothetical protein [Candidatus Polarisedimenticolia bacterium]
MKETAHDAEAGPKKGWFASAPGLFVFFFLLALLPRLWVLHIALHHETPVYRHQDSGGYLEAGESLARGRGYRGSEGTPLFWWPPGYPGFLALTFRAGVASPTHPGGSLLAQALLASMVVGMTALLALKLGGPSAAWLAGALMTFEPSSIAYADVLLSEALFTFLLMLSVIAWARWWETGGAGRWMLFASLASSLPFVRPMALYLWIPLALLVGFFGPAVRRRAWLAALFVGVTLMPIAAWTLRNYSYLHVPVFATVSQFNEALFARSVEDLAGEPRPAASTRQPWQEGFGQEEGLPFEQVMRTRDRYFWKVFAHHPLIAGERLVLTGLEILGVPDQRLPDLLLREFPQSPQKGVAGRLKWLSGLGWLGALLLFGMFVSVAGSLALGFLVLRCRAWPPDRRALLALLVVLVLYHLLIGASTMYQGDRFRVPVIPLLAAALGCALSGGFRAAARERALT